MKTTRPAFKCHGGKYYLSRWVISHFPADYQAMTYLEPFAGAASVLINKVPSREEAINDLDKGVVNIFRALRDESKEFIGRLRKLKYAEPTFLKAVEQSAKPVEDYLEHAVNEFILRRMSRGGLKKAFAWSNRTRGGQPGDVNAWNTALDLLPTISERLQGVFIFNNHAVQVIRAFDREDTLVYADPPYLHETRISKDAYAVEMDTDGHIQLADALNRFRGKAVVSGYPSTLYNRLYKGWKCVKQRVANNASQKRQKQFKTEVLWIKV